MICPTAALCQTCGGSGACGCNQSGYTAKTYEEELIEEEEYKAPDLEAGTRAVSIPPVSEAPTQKPKKHVRAKKGDEDEEEEEYKAPDLEAGTRAVSIPPASEAPTQKPKKHVRAKKGEAGTRAVSIPPASKAPTQKPKKHVRAKKGDEDEEEEGPDMRPLRTATILIIAGLSLAALVGIGLASYLARGA